MFEIGKNYSINKKTIVDLFPETKMDISKEEPNFLKEQPSSFTVPKFLHLNSNTSSQNLERRVTEADLYEDNGGTALVISVENKIIIAADTRHSSEYTINSRKMTKIYKIGDFYLTAVGFFPDGVELYSQLMYHVKQYETYNKITLKALAHLLHNVLYAKRFFPYYSYAALSGFVDGVATIYAYDPVGSYEKTKCICNGSGSRMIQPLLDSWVMGKNFKNFTELTFDQMLELVKKAFDGAAERDVKTKDFLEILVLEEGTSSYELIPLRKD